MGNSSKTCIIIPNWNGADFISECLHSLDKQTYDHKIVLVDNGSRDNSVLIVEKNHPKVTVLKQKENLGFAGGVNVGIKYALEQGAEYIALFNNDAVADKNWLKELIKSVEAAPGAGIITGKLLQKDDGKIDSTGEQFSVWGMPFPRGRGEKDVGQYDTKSHVFGASGGASLYRADIFKDIGYFDEDFFAYYEDADISFRAQLAGWKVLYTPKAVAHHKIGATSKKLGDFTRYHATKNFYLLCLKNMPIQLLLRYWLLFILQAVILFAGNVRHGAAKTHIKAEWAVIKQFNKTLDKRHAIQSNKRVSTSYIKSILHHGRNPRPPKP